MTPPAKKRAKVLRMDAADLDAIEEVAELNGRSANAEIVVTMRRHVAAERRRRARAAVK